MSLNHPHRITLLGLLLAICFTVLPAADARVSDVYRVDFPGGTVAEYIELIRETVPDINIVLMPNASEVQIPSFRLHGWPGNEGVFFNVLEYVTHDSGPDELDVSWDGDLFFIRLASPYAPDSSQHQQVQETRLQSHSLADVLVADHLTAEDVLQSIEAVLDLHGNNDFQPELRFHEPTSLLIIRGMEEQLIVVGQAIHELRKSAEIARVKRDQEESEYRVRQLRRREAELQAQIMEQDRLIADLRRQVEHLTAVLEGRERN